MSEQRVSQSNEQLIEDIKEWSCGTKRFLPDTMEVCVRALLEENKRLDGMFDDANHRAAVSKISIDELYTNLQETKKELDSAYANIRNVNALLDTRESQWNATTTELEQVKAERDGIKQKWYTSNKIIRNRDEEIESLRTELSAKDKVLEWYAAEKSYEVYTDPEDEFAMPGIEVLDDRGGQARSILSQYEVKPNDPT